MRDLLIIAPTLSECEFVDWHLRHEGCGWIPRHHRVDFCTPQSALRHLEGRRDVVIIPWRYEAWRSEGESTQVAETWDAIIRGQVMTNKIDIFWLHESDFA